MAGHLRFDAADPSWADRDRVLVEPACAGLARALERLLGNPGQFAVFDHALAAGVGHALAERILTARFGRSLVDHRTWVLCTAEWLATGAVQEAAWLAGTWRLGRLAVLAEAGEAQPPGLAGIAANGWTVRRVAAGDGDAVEAALSAAVRSYKPTLVLCVGVPATPPSQSPPAAEAAWQVAGSKRAATRRGWLKRLARHASRTQFATALSGRPPPGWHAALFEPGPSLTGSSLTGPSLTGPSLLGMGPQAATLATLQAALAGLAAVLPDLAILPGDPALPAPALPLPAVAASATPAPALHPPALHPALHPPALHPPALHPPVLHPSVPHPAALPAPASHSSAPHSSGLHSSAHHESKLPATTTTAPFQTAPFTTGASQTAASHPVKAAGHRSPAAPGGAVGKLTLGMGAAQLGAALHGGLLPVAAQPACSLDQLMPMLRAAALTHARLVQVLIEPDLQEEADAVPRAGLATMRNLLVFRPADVTETLECLELAVRRAAGPSVLVVSGAPMKLLAERPSRTRSARGGYVAAEARGVRAATLLASGQELHLALGARAALARCGVEVAVVSLPCWELFALQEEGWRDAVLGAAPRIGLEAGSGFGWDRWLGEAGLFVSPEPGPAEAQLRFLRDAVLRHLGRPPAI